LPKSSKAKLCLPRLEISNDGAPDQLRFGEALALTGSGQYTIQVRRKLDGQSGHRANGITMRQMIISPRHALNQETPCHSGGRAGHDSSTHRTSCEQPSHRPIRRRGIQDVLGDYPYLEQEDMFQALRYASWRAEEREVVLAGA
jgi:hypothetical protein